METKIISVVGEKGGIGKTTLNILLASYLYYAQGKNLVILYVDDPQYSIHKKREREVALSHTSETDLLDMYPIEPVTVNDIQDAILKYYGQVDFIIVDLPGTLNVNMVKGLLYVEHVFIPFDHDELEIDSTSHFYFTLKRVLKSIHLFFNKYKLVKKNKFSVLRQQFMDAGLPMMKSVVKEKTIYKEQYRNTLYPVPENKELGKMDIKKFFEEVVQLSN